MTVRCESCGLPVSMSKRRRDLLQLVSEGRWHDVADDDLGRLESLAQDGLVFWIEPKPPDFAGGIYRISERGHEMLEADT